MLFFNIWEAGGSFPVHPGVSEKSQKQRELRQFVWGIFLRLTAKYVINVKSITLNREIRQPKNLKKMGSITPLPTDLWNRQLIWHHVFSQSFSSLHIIYSICCRTLTGKNISSRVYFRCLDSTKISPPVPKCSDRPHMSSLSEFGVTQKCGGQSLIPPLLLPLVTRDAQQLGPLIWGQ